jgi:hypothetical protein
MSKLAVVAGLLVAAFANTASASVLDIEELRDAVRSVTQTLLGLERPDGEVIAAPRDLDRQMALIPPRDRSHMPVFKPPR